MIMEILKPDCRALCACSLSGRSLRSVVQHFLGQHISVTDHQRVKECIQLLNNSGFQHVQSLSLGIRNQKVIPEDYLVDYLEILEVFTQRSLVQLLLWDFLFCLLQPQQKKAFKDIILGLSSLVKDLGLYGCHFSCYEEMVSFVHVFPHCHKLYLQESATDGQDLPENLLARFPQHKLSIINLDLTALLTSEFLIDLLGFIEDTELDVSLLSVLTCKLLVIKGISHVILSTSEPPIRALRFSSTFPDGFQGVCTYLFLFWVV